MFAETADKNLPNGGDALPPVRVSKGNIKLFLYTRGKKNVEINDENINDVEEGTEVKILSHGWNEDKTTWYYPKLTEILLTKADYNVIQVDWSSYSKQLYPKAAASTKGVGERLV